jgi:hypothetical protein
VEFLRGCYWSVGKEKAPGIDGQRWRDYGRDLDANLRALVARLKAKREHRKLNTFEFLGFTHYCGTSRGGGFLLGRKTAKKRLVRACRKLSCWLKAVRPLPMKLWWPKLAAKLRGHYQYYGLSGNSRAIWTFDYRVKRLLYKWLNRRSQCKTFRWRQLNAYLAKYPLPKPRIVHKFY